MAFLKMIVFLPKLGASLKQGFELVPSRLHFNLPLMLWLFFVKKLGYFVIAISRVLCKTKFSIENLCCDECGFANYCSVPFKDQVAEPAI